MLEFGRLGHACINFAIVFARDRHPFDAQGRNTLVETLHCAIEQDLLDAALPCESELTVALGRQMALLVFVAFLRRLAHTAQHISQTPQAVPCAQHVEGKVMGMNAITVCRPADVVPGQRCANFLCFLLQQQEEVDVVREDNHLPGQRFLRQPRSDLPAAPMARCPPSLRIAAGEPPPGN